LKKLNKLVQIIFNNYSNLKKIILNNNIIKLLNNKINCKMKKYQFIKKIKISIIIKINTLMMMNNSN